MDEASQCAPALSLLAMSSARRVVLVGDIEQLPPVYHANAAEAAARSAGETGIPVPGRKSPYALQDVEASQCAPALSLLAMSSARRVVLVGDIEQLPPVYHANAAEAAARSAGETGIPVPGRKSPYALQDVSTGDGMSILASAQAVFEPIGAPHTFLNEHFRCHPGIIGFCSDEIYAPRGEGLVVRTPAYDRSVQTPIRIRWFEGDYWEPHRHDRQSAKEASERKAQRGAPQSSKENRKQIEIFMHEEWPGLRARLETDPSFSVRIVSPFRGQLEALYDRLVDTEGAAAIERLFHVDKAEAVDSWEKTGLTIHKTQGQEYNAVYLLPVEDGEAEAVDSWEKTGLTIHKTQGQEYNAVYLLPVEDGDWDWRWSQGRSIINVAVSRAKDELVVICSTDLMSKETQLALTGTYIPPSPGGAARALSTRDRAEREQRERFLQKLIDYARRRMDPASDAFTGERGFPISNYAYGFHRSSLVSAFDEIPAIQTYVGNEDSAAELALCNALESVDLAGRGLAVARGVALSSCFSPRALSRRLTDDEEFRAADKKTFIQHGDAGREERFDFVIYNKQTMRIVLCIEIDDGRYRHTSPEIPNDGERALARRRRRLRCKNSIVRDMGGQVIEGNARTAMAGSGSDMFSFAMLRLATNGTTAAETELIATAISHDEPRVRPFATIDELIDLQMAHGTESGPTLAPSFDTGAHALPERGSIAALVREGASALVEASPQSEARYLQKVLDDWTGAGAFPKMRSHQANKLLQEGGLIERRADGWHVTPHGAKLGIIGRVVEYDGVESARCLYPASCEKAVRNFLLQALGD